MIPLEIEFSNTILQSIKKIPLKFWIKVLKAKNISIKSFN